MTFYGKVLDSGIVGHHFEDVDMPRLMDHQTKFVSALMGGPAAMSDDRPAHVHRQIDITGLEFDEVVRLLSKAMKEHGIDQDDILDVADLFEAKRALILQPFSG